MTYRNQEFVVIEKKVFQQYGILSTNPLTNLKSIQNTVNKFIVIKLKNVIMPLWEVLI